VNSDSKKQYRSPQITDLGDVASITLGANNNNGFDDNPDMGRMAGMS
jgi:hypothetical protein